MSQTFSARHFSNMNPSTTRGRTLSDVAQHWPQCTAVTQCSKSRAVATEKAATAPQTSPRTHRGAPAALWALYGFRAMSARPLIGQPCDLFLVLDAPSAGTEGTVVWNVMGILWGSIEGPGTHVTYGVASLYSSNVNIGPRTGRNTAFAHGAMPSVRSLAVNPARVARG